MADDVRDNGMNRKAANAASATAPGQTAVPTAVPSRAERARRSAYRRRFAVLYVILAAIAGAAIGAALVLGSRGGPEASAPWSEWQPTGSTEGKAAQIADRVADTYRLPSGHELATVTYSGPPMATGENGAVFQVPAIAVQGSGSSKATSLDDVDAVDARRAVMYSLCESRGASCTIEEGQPSTARGQLLRRQALELALYSFRYLDEIESVLVLLPQRQGEQTSNAVFLAESDLQPQLDRPLSRTLTAPLTPGVGEIAADEQAVIDRTTLRRQYQTNLVQTQDGSAVLVLTPTLSD